MSDRITIINNDDGTVDVMINGENLERVPTSKLNEEIHAVQWYGDHGEVEYNDHNEDITDFSVFQGIVDDRNAEETRRHEADIAEALANEPSEEEKDRRNRDIALSATDWVVIKYTELGQPIPSEWATYRQALRDITEQDGFPGNVVWPEEPTTNP